MVCPEYNKYAEAKNCMLRDAGSKPSVLIKGAVRSVDIKAFLFFKKKKKVKEHVPLCMFYFSLINSVPHTNQTHLRLQNAF